MLTVRLRDGPSRVKPYPDVRKIYFVGRCTVYSNSFSNFSCGKEDEHHDRKLKYSEGAACEFGK